MDRKLLNINGVPTIVMCELSEKLSDVLRGQLGLTGTKVACGQGQCGSCSVILNGKVVRSCTTTMKRVPAESEITTIEGIGRPDKLHALQLAWILHGGAQCGYCSPGFIVSVQGAARPEPGPDPGRGPRLVAEARQRLPLHRLQAARRRRHRRRQGPARRDERGRARRTRCLRTATSGTRGSRGRRAVAKVTGTIDYGADYELKMPPGTLHCAVVHAKVSHANILSIDVTEAEKMPGVFKVVTHKDVKGKNRINGLVMFPEDTKARRLGAPHPLRHQGVPVRRRAGHRLRRHAGAGQGGGRQGQGGARGVAGVHERARRHGRRRHRDLPRHAQRLLHTSSSSRARTPRRSSRRLRTWSRASTTCSASRTSSSSRTAASPTPTKRAA